MPSCSQLGEALVQRLAGVFGCGESGRSRWSVSQKWRASERRARTTRSLPPTILPPPSLASILATRTKRLAERARGGIAQHEALLVGADGGADHLGRDGEECLVERAHEHDRPFHEPATSSSRASSSTSSSPRAKARLRASARMISLRRSASSTTYAFSQRGHVILEAAHEDEVARHEAVTARHVGGADAVDLERDDFRLLGLGAERAEDGLQRAHPAQRARR